jgi:hypothetical protein
MVLRNAIIEAERVEQPALVPLCRPIIAKSPAPTSSADGNTVRRFSQRLYRQHRSKADPNAHLQIVGFVPGADILDVVTSTQRIDLSTREGRRVRTSVLDHR